MDDDSHKSVGQCKIRDGGGDGNKQGGGCASGVERQDDGGASWQREIGFN